MNIATNMNVIERVSLLDGDYVPLTRLAAALEFFVLIRHTEYLDFKSIDLSVKTPFISTVDRRI